MLKYIGKTPPRNAVATQLLNEIAMLVTAEPNQSTDELLSKIPDLSNSLVERGIVFLPGTSAGTFKIFTNSSSCKNAITRQISCILL